MTKTSNKMGSLKRGIINRFRSFLGRYTITGCYANLYLAKNVKIEPGAVIELGSENGKGVIHIGSRTLIRRFALISCHGGNIHIGSNCSVQCFSAVYGLGGLRIGDWTRIAAHTLIIPGNHEFSDPFVEIKKQGLSQKGISVGRDVWIAANCLILDGVNIGDGAVIGGGSVVTKSIPSLAVAVGNPARVIKYRGCNPLPLIMP
jgi:acetyltransferase-like isoleucine patch superfamily enzyme